MFLLVYFAESNIAITVSDSATPACMCLLQLCNLIRFLKTSTKFHTEHNHRPILYQSLLLAVIKLT